MSASSTNINAGAASALGLRPNVRAAPLHLRRRFAAVAAITGGVTLLASWLITGTVFSVGNALAVGAYAIAIYLAGQLFRRNYPHARLGPCNVVTIARLALVASLLAAFVAESVSVSALLSVAVLAFAMDGFDGWLARRDGLASDFGSRFDVEVDCGFALVLAALAVLSGLHPLVILLGLPRYLFGAAQHIAPVLVAPLPPRFSRKAICVAQIAVLITLLIPGIDPALKHSAAAICGALVVWSFAVDIRAILRNAV